MKLIIEEYQAKVILGVYPHEKESKCDILISLEIEFDPGDAVKNDDVNYTIDYDNIVKKIDGFLYNKDYNLIEKLISDLGEDLLIYFPLIDQLNISIHKLGIIKKAKKIVVNSRFIRNS